MREFSLCGSYSTVVYSTNGTGTCVEYCRVDNTVPVVEKVGVRDAAERKRWFRICLDFQVIFAFSRFRLRILIADKYIKVQYHYRYEYVLFVIIPGSRDPGTRPDPGTPRVHKSTAPFPNKRAEEDFGIFAPTSLHGKNC